MIYFFMTSYGVGFGFLTSYITFKDFFDLAKRDMMRHDATQPRGGLWTVCNPPLRD